MLSTNMNKKIIIASLVVVLAIFGAYFFPRPVKQSVLAGSPQGATFNSSFQASVVASLASPGANATSSSVYNGSGSDYYITAIKAGCESVGTSKTAYSGGGLASLQLSVGTSTASAPAVIPTNLVGGGAVVIGTSTATFVISTSTSGGANGTPSAYAIWPNGSYMTFWANATNTATCTFGVDYFSS